MKKNSFSPAFPYYLFTARKYRSVSKDVARTYRIARSKISQSYQKHIASRSYSSKLYEIELKFLVNLDTSVKTSKHALLK